MTENLPARPNDHLHKKMEDDPIGFVESSENLNPQDFCDIGTIIQSYSFADYNARRILDALRSYRDGDDWKSCSKSNDTQILSMLLDTLNSLADFDIKQDIIRPVSFFNENSEVRHLVAHRALRRIPNEDFFLLLSKNGKEAERNHGIIQEKDHLIYDFLPIRRVHSIKDNCILWNIPLAMGAHQLITQSDKYKLLLKK